MDLERKITYPELASLFHGVLFSYEKTLLDLYGNHIKDIFPYLIEEMNKIFHINDNPILDPDLPFEENLEIIGSFLSDEEMYSDVKINKIKKNSYEMEIGECTFAKNGVHDALKLKDGSTCPMAISVAAMITSLLGPNEYAELGKSEFLEKGTKTKIKVKRIKDELIGDSEIKSVKGADAPGNDDKLLNVKGVGKPPLDPIDLQLVNILRTNGRVNNVDLAETLKTSEATVRRRIQNLIEKGYIKGFSALLDYTKFTPKIRVYLNLKVEDQNRDELIESLNSESRVCSLYRTLGDYNIMAEMLFDDMPSIQKFMDNISRYENVNKINYHIATSPYKPCPWYGI